MISFLKTMVLYSFLLLIFPLYSNFAFHDSPTKIKTLYNSLDQKSIQQHLAFYDLYPQTREGKEALSHVWLLLKGEKEASGGEWQGEFNHEKAFKSILSLVNKQPQEPVTMLTEEELRWVDALGKKLPNRRLKGSKVWKEDDVVDLPSEEVDLARGIFLTQFGSDKIQEIKTYEAMIDLMALQILAKISLNDPPESKISAINEFIFYDLGFRFPPHSEYAKDIDVYTFLPSVLDGRKGVCLGVSILYICLAQRLNLPLEMITPPGHIYVRYKKGNQEINIETTARGVHVDSEEYLSVSIKGLQQRTIKEVIGLAHFNQASVYWMLDKYEEAMASYEKAKPYLPDDKLLKELMGYQYLFLGNREKGTALLNEVKDFTPEDSIYKEAVAEDFLMGHTDIEGIKVIYRHVDEKRDSIVKKCEILKKLTEKYPLFKAGWFNLASSWLQLHRHQEALEVLEHYHQLAPQDPTGCYYLTQLYAERNHYPKAWEFLKKTEEILNRHHHHSKIIQELRRDLTLKCPE